MKILQNIMKAAKIICVILIVVYIIMVSAAVLGLIGSFFADSLLKIGKLSIGELTQLDGEWTLPQLRVVLGGFVLVGTAELVLLSLLNGYLKRELAAGTPFTKESANEVLWLGVKSLSAFAGAMLLCAILRLIVFGNTDLPPVETEVFLLGNSGVELLLLSVIFRAGAEQKQTVYQKGE